MKVFKFGGASIRDARAVQNLQKIVREQGSIPTVIVVSAMGKCTNWLEKILGLKLTDSDFTSELEAFKEYHLKICGCIFSSTGHAVFDKLEQLFSELLHILENSQDPFDKIYDQFVCYGELISSTIIHSFLLEKGDKCTLLDARKLIITDSTFREGKVRWDLTRKTVRQQIEGDSSDHVITQGFIAGDEYGNSLTLGREGSDFTAAILASCLDADSVTIWKDVPGVLNADPDIWENTIKYDALSYGEAAEMTYYGASVIHPKTIRPLAGKKIPLIVKSFEDPAADGTKIIDIQHDTLEPAIIYKKNQCLISFQVSDLSFINESKISMIFHLFEEFNIKVNMMQSSAISFSVCVDSPDKKMKMLINSLSGEFEIYYNDRLQLITLKNYRPELISQILKDKEILLEQRTRKNYQALIQEKGAREQGNIRALEH